MEEEKNVFFYFIIIITTVYYYIFLLLLLFFVVVVFVVVVVIFFFCRKFCSSRLVSFTIVESFEGNLSNAITACNKHESVVSRLRNQYLNYTPQQLAHFAAHGWNAFPTILRFCF